MNVRQALNEAISENLAETIKDEFCLSLATKLMDKFHVLSEYGGVTRDGNNLFINYDFSFSEKQTIGLAVWYVYDEETEAVIPQDFNASYMFPHNWVRGWMTGIDQRLPKIEGHKLSGKADPTDEIVKAVDELYLKIINTLTLQIKPLHDSYVHMKDTQIGNKHIKLELENIIKYRKLMVASRK